MKLGSPIAMFTVFMISLIVTIVLSFMLPLNQILITPILLMGVWFILLGITQEVKQHEVMTTTPSIYIVYGGLMLTISATYLTYINIPDVRLLLLVFIFGVMLTVILSYLIGEAKKVDFYKT